MTHIEIYKDVELCIMEQEDKWTGSFEWNGKNYVQDKKFTNEEEKTEAFKYLLNLGRFSIKYVKKHK